MKKIFFSIILCSLSTFLLSAAEPDMPVPQDAIITISGSRITLESFISQVEKQTGYLFVYSKQDVNVNSVLPVREGKKTVAAFLAEAFGNSNLKYVFENQYIVLTYKAPEYSTVSGTVIDAQTRKPLVFASLYIVNRGISNVTNGEGFFSLKFPPSFVNDSLRISFLGYHPQTFALKDMINKGDKLVVALNFVPTTLPTIMVTPQNAYELISRALEKIPNNYPLEPMQMTGFYREMIRKGNNYVTLTEAVLDINKTSYGRMYGQDQVGVFKGRGSVDWARIDTVFVKFRGGINSALQIDVAKYPFLGTNVPEINQIYDFTMEEPVQIDGKINHVVGFKQKESVDDIWFRGKIYIDMKSEAISRIEFNMNVEGRSDAANIFISRRPVGFRAEVLYATYLVQYKQIGGKWTFDYSRTEIKFDSKWDRKLFKNTYTITSELAVTERSDKAIKIPSEERVRSTDITLDKVTDFQDEGFWDDYNVIEPESGIEQVIARITRQLKRRAQEQ
ncbi:MAG TPA: STN and carboxypeptidase regulatory-like domain-containing protein [Bacteroidales bacterium]|nr:MAG: hypothetical protein BWX93_00134 [Bacteroidetes bacterium ADurb.Bin139]HOG25521.1 STN and carboxypeptidase regulatory-like domain-containing protein [Bacteroidales bacterium]HOR10907.1 STN and carboxypeptidase regulatory-like domain-containing protein [Bacteroidales bacterium]HOZ19332.1 STN and carboxypeptidase regulatory-like domain-containing protein [Bacteroidales bacterium]HPB78116.1 STN and carboxypeptidase regulatory-like domain-containing protein [Bacteroidales bacterium]